MGDRAALRDDSTDKEWRVGWIRQEQEDGTKEREADVDEMMMLMPYK